ncbi:Trans-1-2-dihydrobenzene-1-2-diol dehydrogenase-like [Homarus americanus]|uniref:Trans-1,2-dihydrobenzene-1,2-diol dehydrogenase n=1 Tax=Homarus americanus TaxID=6706 RepID=A0A8J5T2V5_HOMAM|nr:Trans-1-2-dihydrobenzene-1-2-diol dehydrogenase-like [Homarus americanus]
MATRWGIVSAGLISNDFVGALKALPEGEHRVVAVAARSLESAKKFASKYGVEKAYGSYDELARDPNVEVVYIGTIQTQHLPVASLMIQAGKHVLCEKPLCMNVKEVKQLIQLAKEKKVFLMEAVWSRFFPVYQELTRRIQSGEIGDVVQVICSFGKSIEDVTRMVRRETGGGATLDLGLYTVQFTTLVMGGDKPQKVLACGHLNDNVNYPMWAPESLESSSGKYESLLPKTGHIFNFENSQGLMYEAVEVRRCLNEGLLESPVMTHKESLTNAEVMEKMRTQVGVKFDQDD